MRAVSGFAFNEYVVLAVMDGVFAGLSFGGCGFDNYHPKVILNYPTDIYIQYTSSPTSIHQHNA